MVNGRTELVPFERVMGGTRNVTLTDELVLTARSLGIAFGDEPPGTFVSKPAEAPPRSGVEARSSPNALGKPA